MKTVQQAAANYVKNGGAQAAADTWAANFSANIPGILQAAIDAIPRWQEAVATAQAAANMGTGLTRAKGNVSAITAKVTTVGKASFKAGVTAAGAPNGDYSLFIGKFMPDVASEVQQLNITNPRGDRSANRARQAAYDSWIDSRAGMYRVK